MRDSRAFFSQAEIIPSEPDPVNTGVVKKTMKKQSLAITVVATALCAPLQPLSAQERADSVKQSADQNGRDMELPEIQVISNRATSTTPVAYTNISRKTIEKVNDGKDIPYLLSMVPSMVFTSDAGAGVGYSAMRVRGTDPSRINVTINGVPQNDAESHRVYWVNMPDLASSVRDIQVQRGAGTSTNGAGAFGATVNMLTDIPDEDAYGELTGGYGAYNTHRTTLRVGSGLLGEHWNIDARISNIGSDGYIDRASSSLWSYFGQLAYSNSGTTLRLMSFGGKEETYMAWDYASKEEMEKYGRRYNPCGKYTADDGSIAFYPDQKDHYTQHNLQLHVGQRLNEFWRINIAAHYTRGLGYYRQYKTDRTLREYGLEPYIGNDGTTVTKSDLIRLKHDNNHFVGAVANAVYFKDNINMNLGAAANNYRGHHFGEVDWVRNYIGPIDPLQRFYNNFSSKFDFNIYGRANISLSRMFSVFADMQYRHINYRLNGSNSNFDYNIDAMQPLDYHERYNFFNPKIGANYTNGIHRLFASWSVAHKEPTRTNFTDGDPNHIPSSEQLIDYEIGYTVAHNIFSVGANLYYMDYKDQLVATGQLSDTGNPLSINVPHSYRMGVELQAGLKPCRWFEWQINATLSRNRIKDFTEYIYEDGWTNPISNYIGSTPIAFSPDFILNNSFNFAWHNFDATLQSHYVGRQYLSNSHSDEEMLDAYFVSNLFLGYTFGNIAGLRDLRLGVTVNNIFNERYESNGYSGAGYYIDKNGEKIIYRYAGYAAQAPINIMTTVTVKF